MNRVAPADMSYLPVIVFAIIAIGFVGGTLILAHLVRPSAPSRAKLDTYECGVEPTGEAWQQFNVHYYLFALLFVVFDVEAAFLFPWAIAFRKAGLYAVGEMLIFVALLGAGLAYAWRRGALEWE